MQDLGNKSSLERPKTTPHTPSFHLFLNQLNAYLYHKDDPSTRPPPPPELGRFSLFLFSGILWGFALGSIRQGRAAGLRYLAEHAHRMPKTVQEWYFYHKTKNYKMALAGIHGGFKGAAQIGGLTTTFGGLEMAFDMYREKSSFLNTVLAGLTTGMAYSAVARLPIHTAKYAAGIGIGMGLVLGLAQEGASWLIGSDIKYRSSKIVLPQSESCI